MLIFQTRELRLRGEVTCPRSHSQEGVERGCDPGLWLPGAALCTSRRGPSPSMPWPEAAPQRGSRSPFPEN